MAKRKLDKSTNLQGALFTPQTVWTAPGQFPNLSGVDLLGVDIESRDPNLHSLGPGFLRGDAEVVGIALGTEDAGWYFPFKHLGGGNLDKASVVRFAKDVLAKKRSTKIMSNAQYDLEGLHSLGITVNGPLRDVQLIEALLDEESEEGYDHGTLCRMHLGRTKDETLLREAAEAYGLDPKKDLWKLPAKYVGPYGEWDGQSNVLVYLKQLEALKKQELMNIFDIEMRLIPLLFAMRVQGIPVDLDAAVALKIRLQKEEDDMRLKMIKQFGRDVNVQSGDEISALCDHLNIAYPRTEAGNASFVSDWLEEQDHPFLELITDIRQIKKLRGDYVEKKIIDCSRNGRIHPQWKQLASDEGGTRTGRFACSQPALQQFPASKKRNGKPNPVGQAIRALLVAPPGTMWFKGDYSQQEPRILTHFAAVCNMAGADAAAFAYRSNPDMDFYNFVMDIAKIDRRPAKTIYLAICYGMGKAKMAMKLNCSLEKAKQMLQELNADLPFISLIADKCMHLAQSRGYVKTLCGRRRHFNYWEPTDSFSIKQEFYQLKKAGNLTAKDIERLDTKARPRDKALEKWPDKRLQRSLCHKALNAVIQGSAADMMKMGLLKGYEEDGRVPFITVHDEVGGPVVDQEDANKWKKTMETCVDISVPIKMDVDLGRSWK